MSAVAVLEELYAIDPSADVISLRGYELESIDTAALEFLKTHFAHITHLDLSHNRLSQLPSELSSCLPALVALDVRENPVASIPELSETLAPFRSLRTLSVSLRNKTDEKVLRVMLPSLQVLNGSSVSDDKGFNVGLLTKPAPLTLDISSTISSPGPSSSGSFDTGTSPPRWLDTPPSAHSRRVRSPQEKRDLRLQFAANAHTKAVSGAKTPASPTPKVLRPTELPATISDEKTDWRKLLKKTTERHEQEQAQRTEPVRSRKSEGEAMSSSSRVFIAELKAILRNFQKRGDVPRKADEQALLEQLERKIDTLSLQLNDLEKPQDGAPTDSHVVVASLAARWRLLETGSLYAVHKANSVDKPLATGLHRLAQTQAHIVDALLKHVNEAIYSQQKWQAASQGQEQAAEQQKQQMKVLLDVAETLEKDLEELQVKYQEEKKQKEQAQAASQTLQSECEELKKKLQEETTPKPMAAVGSKSGSGGSSQRRIRRRTGGSGDVETRQQQQTRPASPVGKQKSPPRAPPPPPIVRSLTLKQLIDLIHCILASKTKYDARIHVIGAPPETVEQHMYSYLNQRFGLQTLIVEYASAIWKGCQLYTRQDNDVAVFHAMLRNQLDEGFIAIKKKLQHAVRELLRAYFHAKHPMKPESTIQTLVEAKLQSGGMVFEEEWTELLTYLYDPSDSSILLRLVKRKSGAFLSEQNEGSGQPRLPFAVFEKLLYDYQLQGRLRLLEGFCQLFSEHDTERVGVVARDKFRAIVAQIAPRKSDGEVAKMMEKVDPFEHDTITFSDAVKSLLQDIRQRSINRKTAVAAASSTVTKGSVTIHR